MSNESDKDEEMSSDVDVLEVDVDEDFDLSLEGFRKLPGGSKKILPHILSQKYFEGVKFKDVEKKNFNAKCSNCKRSCSGSLQ